MEKLTFNQIRQQYIEKNCEALNNMANYINPIYCLNSALLDKDVPKISTYRKHIDRTGCNYEIINIADKINNKSRLRIVYLIASTEISDGAKILFEQSNKLVERGHDVLLFSHSPKPDWIECCSNFFLVHHDCNLSTVIPSADIVIAGYWDLVLEALKVNAPLKYYFAQGDYDIFEYNISNLNLKTAISTAYSLPLRILTVSDTMKQRILQSFGRKSIKVPNALDKEFLVGHGEFESENDPLEILLVGTDNFYFKGQETVLDVLQYLKCLGYRFYVNWLTQQKLQGDYSKYGFVIKEYISPQQEVIKNIYRSSDIYICNSYYESFCLPALEAMASGTAVITSDNGGVREFAVDGYNSLIYEPGNVIKMAYNLQTILNDCNLRIKLKRNGLMTAKKFTWNRSISKLEKEFKVAASCTFQAVGR